MSGLKEEGKGGWVPKPVFLFYGLGDFCDLFDVVEKPWINPGDFMNAFHRPSLVERVAEIPQTGRIGDAELHRELVLGNRGSAGSEVEATFQTFDVQRSQGFHEGFLECPANAHGLSDAFHRGGQNSFCPRELLKCETRDLCDDIVEGRFKGGGGASGDVVF